MSSWNVTLSFPFDPSWAMDAVIEACVGRASDYSGAGIDGMRDLGWVVFSEQAGEALASKAKREYPGVSSRVYEQVQS